MAVRQETLDRYAEFLRELNRKTTPFSLGSIIRYHKIDTRVATILKRKGLVIPFGELSEGMYVTNFKNTQIDELAEDIVETRVSSEQQAKQDEEYLQYYKENKDYLVDLRHSTTLTDSIRQHIIDETKQKLIKEVAEYAAIAVKLGKKDIAAFITAMINLK